VRKASGSSAALSESEEMEIIVRAVCATKLPTLTFDDTRCVAGAGYGSWWSKKGQVGTLDKIELVQRLCTVKRTRVLKSSRT
jgi:hypothetical protein